MSIRKVYINPGEMIEFRIIKDNELPKNAAEWNFQIRPRSILITFHSDELIEHADPKLQVMYKGLNKKILLSPKLIEKETK